VVPSALDQEFSDLAVKSHYVSILLINVFSLPHSYVHVIVIESGK